MRPRQLSFALSMGAALAWGAATALAGEQEPEAAAEHAGHERAQGALGEAEHDGAEINWAYGFLGEKEGVEPDFLYRPKGMPPPFLANVANAGMLFMILFTFGRKPVAEALKQRKLRIVAGMDDAARMKAEAQKELREYEEKLARLDSEVERIRKEMHEAAEVERRRILSEAKERRERLERDAHLLVEQEQKAARDALIVETVTSALKSAEEILAARMTDSDHDRLSNEYLETVGRSQSAVAGVAP